AGDVRRRRGRRPSDHGGGAHPLPAGADHGLRRGVLLVPAPRLPGRRALRRVGRRHPHGVRPAPAGRRPGGPDHPDRGNAGGRGRVGVICSGRVVIVTGAGRGLGRGHALELARQGARVVVNDIGAELDGTGRSTGPGAEVVAEIEAAGGEAVLNTDDVADWEGAQRLVNTAFDAFGRLDAVVNNAGFLRDRMFVNATEEEWDAVVRVHMKGHFCVSRWAAAAWRDLSKAGQVVDARIVNTTSGAGLLGSVGQSVYSAAKAGIVGLTLVQA